MGKIAFVFSGQGAQYSGMGKELKEHSPAAAQVFNIADSLRPGTSMQCFEAAKEELGKTQNTQPCLFTVDLAAAQALAEAGITPEGVAGFSLGEIPALAFCGVISPHQAFELVMLRAEVMAKCAAENSGSMAAVLGLADEKVEELCSKFNNLWPVNYNCKGQIVVAGKQEMVEQLAPAAKQEGGKVMKLAVSGAFHTPFMEEAAKALQKKLAGWNLNLPSIPLYANVSAMPYDQNISDLICRQVKSPVLWRKTIENMRADGFDIFIEVGAGKTLSGLIRKICPECGVYNVEDKQSLESTVEALRGGIYA